MKLSQVQLLASICRESLPDFCREFWHTVVPEALTWNWHMDVMCREIQAVAERIFNGESKKYDLLINVPPGSSKSTICSIMAPAWAWTRMPSFRTIGASYAHPLAMELARKCRDVVGSELYRECFPEVVLSTVQNSKVNFTNTKGGSRYAVGANGSITGLHGHLIVIDDPIDPNRAVSDVEMLQINDWIKNTLCQRKVSKSVSAVLMVMQRLHQDDPAANMLRRHNVRHICIPATTEFAIKPPELADNYVDGLMDPVRLPRDVLDDERAAGAMGEFGFAGQFGQCLAGGTLVSTARGQVPISRVVAGDRVWTRGGLRPVAWAGQTGTAETIVSALFSNGAVLSGTPSHPVWAEGVGWVSLDALGGGLYNRVFHPTQDKSEWAGRNYPRRKSSFSTAFATSASRGKTTTATAATAGTACTATFGGSTTVTSPRALISTTRTATRVTTTLTILNACPRWVTASGTVNAFGRLSILRFLRKSARSATLGISPRRAATIIVNTAERHSRRCGRLPRSVSIRVSLAGNRSRPGRSKPRCTVRTSVTIGTASGNTKGIASTAARNSSPAKAGPRTAPVSVAPFGGVPVYDITVAGLPEFYANGILVHNSPVPAGGGTFKTDQLRWGTPPAKFKRVVRFWDKAATAAKNRKSRAAYTVGVKMGLDADGRVWVLDVRRFREDSSTRERLIHRTAKRDGPGVEIGVEREPGSGGKDSAVATVKRLRGFVVRVETARESKGLRADEFSVQVNEGLVFLPGAMREGNSWVGWAKDYVDELRHWPNSTFKDQGDASGGAYTLLTRGRIRVGPLKRKVEA